MIFWLEKDNYEYLRRNKYEWTKDSCKSWQILRSWWRKSYRAIQIQAIIHELNSIQFTDTNSQLQQQRMISDRAPPPLQFNVCVCVCFVQMITWLHLIASFAKCAAIELLLLEDVRCEMWIDKVTLFLRRPDYRDLRKLCALVLPG